MQFAVSNVLVPITVCILVIPYVIIVEVITLLVIRHMSSLRVVLLDTTLPMLNLILTN